MMRDESRRSERATSEPATGERLAWSLVLVGVGAILVLLLIMLLVAWSRGAAVAG
jgi:LPXTG-motif cell wall-anchored protein